MSVWHVFGNGIITVVESGYANVKVISKWGDIFSSFLMIIDNVFCFSV